MKEGIAMLIVILLLLIAALVFEHKRGRSV